MPVSSTRPCSHALRAHTPGQATLGGPINGSIVGTNRRRRRRHPQHGIRSQAALPQSLSALQTVINRTKASENVGAAGGASPPSDRTAAAASAAASCAWLQLCSGGYPQGLQL